MSEATAVVLIIDDDLDLIEAARLVLESQGYEVQVASDGEEGLRRMRANRPDLVILDVMMSHMLEGVAVVREMLADRELALIPVIMVSSIQREEYVDFLPTEDPCFNGVAFLTKPVQPEDLLEYTREALAAPRRCDCI